jgi:uncharacterized membrane protein
MIKRIFIISAAVVLIFCSYVVYTNSSIKDEQYGVMVDFFHKMIYEEYSDAVEYLYFPEQYDEILRKLTLDNIKDEKITGFTIHECKKINNSVYQFEIQIENPQNAVINPCLIKINNSWKIALNPGFVPDDILGNSKLYIPEHPNVVPMENVLILNNRDKQ